MTEAKILGNPERKSSIDDLLKRAGKDSVVQGALRKKDEKPQKKTKQKQKKHLGKVIGLEEVGRFIHPIPPNHLDGVSFHPNGKHVITSCYGDGLKVFEFDPTFSGHGGFTLVNSYGEEKCHIRKVAFSPDGKKLAVAIGDYIDILGFDESGLSRVYKTGFNKAKCQSNIYGMAFSPDGKELAVVSMDCYLRIFRIDKSNLRGIAERKHTPGPHEVAFSPNGKRIITGNLSHELYMFSRHNLDDGPVKLSDIASSVRGISFNPDNRNEFVVASGELVGYHRGYLEIYRFDNNYDKMLQMEPVFKKDFERELRGVSFGKNGYIAVVGEDRCLRVFEVMREENAGA